MFTAFKVFLVFGIVLAQPDPEPLRLADGDQVYCPGLSMTVHNAGSDTAVVFVHGGGWRAGGRGIGEAYTDEMTAAGFTYVTIDLTLGSAPQQVLDTICALEYLKARGIDRIGLIGKSSGGHVAAVVSLTYGVDAAALLSAPLALDINCKNDVALAYFGMACRDLAASNMNPVNLIYSPYQCTYWLGHGANDKVVYAKASREFAREFQSIGGRASLNIFGGGHEGLWVPEVVAFFTSMFGR